MDNAQKIFLHTSLIVANCTDPTPLYGYVDPFRRDGVYFEGETVNFTCQSAADLVGAESSTCNASGAWNPEPPICEPGKLVIPLSLN